VPRRTDGHIRSCGFFPYQRQRFQLVFPFLDMPEEFSTDTARDPSVATLIYELRSHRKDLFFPKRANALNCKRVLVNQIVEDGRQIFCPEYILVSPRSIVYDK
jgi:hypothetical protein